VDNKTALGNGLRIVTERIPHLKSVSVGIWVNIGSRDEKPDESGLSHMIEHMIFKGTSRRTARQIAKEIDQVGGMSNAFTSKEFTCFHAKVMSDHLPLVTDLLTDIFLNSLFAPEDLERERQVILQEIHMLEDTPDELVHVLFSLNLWPHDPLGSPVLGHMETVSSFTPKEIRAYLARNYLAPNIVVAAVGDVDHQAFVDLMAPSFESGLLPPIHRSDQRPQAQAGIHVTTRNLEQVHLCLGSTFPSALEDERYPAALLNIILGGNMSSRLFQEIRENRGLAYSVYSFLSAYLDTGMLGIYAGVDRGQTEETIRLILAELDKMRKGEIDKPELKAAQEHLKGSIILGSESPDSRMIRLAKNEITYGRYIDFDEILDQVAQVTVDQVVGVARKYLSPENLSLTVLGPLEPSDLSTDVLTG